MCIECLDSAIMDAGDCQALYHSIRDYYEGLYMRIDQQIPMLLVERQALNEAIEGEKDVSFLWLFQVLSCISWKLANFSNIFISGSSPQARNKRLMSY